MSQIQIIRKASDLPAGAFSMCGFSDAKGNRLIVQPVESGENVVWTVPDTDENRGIFRRDFAPGGFQAKTIDERQATPMDADERDVLNAKISNLESELGAAKKSLKDAIDERDMLQIQLEDAKAEIELMKVPAENGDAGDSAKSTSKVSSKKSA